MNNAGCANKAEVTLSGLYCIVGTKIIQFSLHLPELSPSLKICSCGGRLAQARDSTTLSKIICILCVGHSVE